MTTSLCCYALIVNVIYRPSKETVGGDDSSFGNGSNMNKKRKRNNDYSSNNDNNNNNNNKTAKVNQHSASYGANKNSTNDETSSISSPMQSPITPLLPSSSSSIQQHSTQINHPVKYVVVQNQ